MKNLELIISRYLDGELTPKEEQLFQRLLQESPEAEAMLRQMEDIRSVARFLPALTPLSAEAESALFQQLFIEKSVEQNQRGIVPVLFRLTESAREKAGSLVPALLLIFTLGGGVWFALDRTGADRTTMLADGLSAATTLSTADAITPNHLESQKAEINAFGEKNKVSEKRLPEYISSVPVGIAIANNAQAEILPTDNRSNSTSDSYDDQKQKNRPLINEEASQTRTSEVPYANNVSEDLEGPNSPTVPEHQALFAENTLSLTQPSLPAPSTSKVSNRLRASYHHGVAASMIDKSLIAAQDLNVRIDGRLNDQHRLSLAVGQSPLLVWERTRTQTQIQTLSIENGEKKGSRTATSPYSSYVQSQRFDDELWAGIGYGYALLNNDLVRVEAGVNLGVGEHSFRYGVELPASIGITDKLALDILPFASRVVPYNQQVRGVSPTEEEQTLDFTTFGAQVGLSLSIGE